MTDLSDWRQTCGVDDNVPLDDPRLHNGYDVHDLAQLAEHLDDWPSGCPACVALREQNQESSRGDV